jgi:hypothetical protein
MIHTMWDRKDDYMVMYLKIGKKDESLSENGTKSDGFGGIL